MMALAIGAISQWPSFFNPFIIIDDVRQHVYWMQQFQNSNLFQNDLMTEYAKNYQPWGFVIFYYIFSFIIDPMVLSKILPVLLFAVSSVYLFRLVQHIAGNFAALLASFIFMMTPIYLDRMVGGLPRAFGYPLILIFLFYLIKRDHLKTAIILVLQCLFYPLIFMLAAGTCFLSLIKIQGRKIHFEKNPIKIRYFILSAILSLSILGGKYLISHNPQIGSIVTRQEMIGKSEFYSEGRFSILPTPPIYPEIRSNLIQGISFSEKIFGSKTAKAFMDSRFLEVLLCFGLLFLIIEVKRKKLQVPVEILFLFISAILMYVIADLLLFHFFLPIRYLKYAVPWLGIIFCSLIIGQVILKIKNDRIKKGIQICLFILMFSVVKIPVGLGLINMSQYQGLYGFLQDLPEDSMIAAHPDLADGIPTFSQKKVFINYELSHCVFDNYWKTMKKRTLDFFTAYYSEDPLFVEQFCQENGIDYLIVDQQHFTKQYLREARIHFEPFNTYVKKLTQDRENFILNQFPEKYKIYSDKHIFVIKTNP